MSIESEEYKQALWDRLLANDLVTAKALMRRAADYPVDDPTLIDLVLDKLEASDDLDFRSAAAYYLWEVVEPTTLNLNRIRGILAGAGDTELSVKGYLRSLLGSEEGKED